MPFLRPCFTGNPVTLTSLLLLLLLAWDASGWDMWLAHLTGGYNGFPLRDNWWLTHAFHDGARRAAWMLVLGLCLAVWWPIGPFIRLSSSRRLQLAVTTLTAVFAISTFKLFSTTSCPWDLGDFGGAARWLSHWTPLADGGPGHCFPAGHASSGLAFFGGYFAFKLSAPRLARLWLLCTLVAGLILGVAQQLRGAHFMSHTLWTGWICWVIALAMDFIWRFHARVEV